MSMCCCCCLTSVPALAVQLESSAYASHGLQSALDDYRRACYDSAAAVRRHLRELASQLQVGWSACGVSLILCSLQLLSCGYRCRLKARRLAFLRASLALANECRQ